jgi:RNA polymerase sigma-70 factor (ECF subfamily)
MAMDGPSEQVSQLVEHLFRHEVGRIMSRLVRMFGAHRLDVAEDAVQFAMLQALRVWSFKDPPEHPQAWLARVATNRCIDVLRGDRRLQSYDERKNGGEGDAAAAPGGGWRSAGSARVAGTPRSPGSAARESLEIERRLVAEHGDLPGFRGELVDERLGLIFVCCHPTLPRAASVALTLKVVCGFGVEEIARAFLANPVAIAQRLVRAKRLIAEKQIRFEVPDPRRLPERLDVVLEVVYLLFTEGYAASSGDHLVRHDLCAEAIRLARLLAGNPLTAEPACHALLALMLLQTARLPARTDEAGDLLLLEEQDRTLWDRALIDQGLRHLAVAARGEALTSYHLQAEIAAIHATTEHFTATNWEHILALYDLLRARQPTLVVLINRAIAVAQVHGPAAGLEALWAIPDGGQRERYPFLHLAEGEFRRRQGEAAAAAACFQRALDLARTAPERRFILKKLQGLEPALPN